MGDYKVQSHKGSNKRSRFFTQEDSQSDTSKLASTQGMLNLFSLNRVVLITSSPIDQSKTNTTLQKKVTQNRLKNNNSGSDAK